jgi:hypothetical protein
MCGQIGRADGPSRPPGDMCGQIDRGGARTAGSADRDVWRTRFKVVDDLADPGSRITELATFEVARGSARVRQVGGLAVA